MQQQPASKCTTRRIRLHRPHHHQITSCVSLRPHSDTEMPKRPVFSDSAAKQAKKQASKKSKGMRCQPLATASFAGGARRAGDGHTQRDWHGADCWLGQGTSCVTLGALQPFDSLAIGRVFPPHSPTVLGGVLLPIGLGAAVKYALVQPRGLSPPYGRLQELGKDVEG